MLKENVSQGNKHTQSCVHFNCRGLSSNWGEIPRFMQHSMLMNLHLTILVLAKFSVVIVTSVLVSLVAIHLLLDVER